MVFVEFLKTDEGMGFNGQVAPNGDSMGGVNARNGNKASGLDHIVDFIKFNDLDVNKLLTVPSPRRRSSTTSDLRLPKFDYENGDFIHARKPVGCNIGSSNPERFS